MDNRQKKIAIVFYGLTRSLKKTYPSFKTNIFDVLLAAGYSYTTYMHTYYIGGPYQNEWTKESCNKYDNTQHMILNPSHLLIDKQDDVLAQLNIESYYSQLGHWTGMTPEMTRFLIRNLALGLYSKKRITEYLFRTGIHYDYVIIMRPDYIISKKIDIAWLSELGPKSIIIPARDWYKGCNDRMCIAKPNVAFYYGCFFDYLLEYSKKKSIVSEHFCLDMLNQANIDIIGKPIEYLMIRANNN